jgi:hypothetical protein
VPNGVHNANGTTHDVPTHNDCISCHTGLDERVNGFSAFQLSHAGAGATMASLSAEGLLTVPAPDGFTPPGGDVDRAALGYMHANCGHCHYFGSAIPPVFDLRLKVTDATVQEAGAYVTGVGVGLVGFSAPGVTKRIVAGDPAASAVVYRMEQRGVLAQMPPIGTEQVHPEGIQAVTDWIAGLQ